MAVLVELCTKHPRGGNGFAVIGDGWIGWCAACHLGNVRAAGLAREASGGRVGVRVEVG
jgi:hypothetical protein